MSRWISDAYIARLLKNNRLLQGNAEYKLWEQEVDRLVDKMPSIDIVWCKECKHNYNKVLNHGKMKPRCDFTDRVLTENDFCSRGEREGE